MLFCILENIFLQAVGEKVCPSDVQQRQLLIIFSCTPVPYQWWSGNFPGEATWRSSCGRTCASAVGFLASLTSLAWKEV